VDLVHTIGGETIQRSLEIIRPFGRLTSIVDIAIPQSLEAWGKNLTIHFVFSPQYRAKLEALTKLIERHQLRPVIQYFLGSGRSGTSASRAGRNTGQNCAEIYGKLDHFTALVIAKRIGV